MQERIKKNPTIDIKFKWSLNKKYPTSMVSVKLIPFTTGITKENSDVERDLKRTNAERKIIKNAAITL